MSETKPNVILTFYGDANTDSKIEQLVRVYQRTSDLKRVNRSSVLRDLIDNAYAKHVIKAV